MGSFGRNIFYGAFWTFGGQIAILGVTLVANILLARLLSPDEFGQLGIIMFFISIATVLTDGGLAGALIRKSDATQRDYQTVFIFNLAVSAICYLLLIAFAGQIARFYGDPLLGELLIAVGLVFIFNAFQLTRDAKLVAQMRFRQRYSYRLVATIAASAVGIAAAYAGFGVWSLVVMQIVNSLLLAAMLWIMERGNGRLTFSRSSFRELYGFGVNTTLASLIDTAFDNIYQLILGKNFSIGQVGQYYQAKKLQDVPGGIVNSMTQGVVFSALAKIQHEPKRFIAVYDRISTIFTALLGLVSILMIIYAKPIISILLGEKWLGAVWFMQLLSVASFFYFKEKITRVIFKVHNRTSILLRLELFKKALQTVTIVAGIVLHSLPVLLWGYIATCAVGYFVNRRYARRIVKGIDRDEVKNIVVITIVGVGLVFASNRLHTFAEFGDWTTFATFPAVALLYIAALHLCRVVDMLNLVKTLKQIVRDGKDGK